MRSKKIQKRKSFRNFQNKKLRKTKKNSKKYRSNKTRKGDKRKTKMRGGMRTSKGPPRKLYGSRSTTDNPQGPGFAQSRGLQESNLLQRFQGGERVLVKIPDTGQWVPGKIIEVDHRSEGGETFYNVKGDNGDHYEIVQMGQKSFDEMIFLEPNPEDHKELGCMCPFEFPICGKATGGWRGGWCMNNETDKEPTTNQSGCGGASGESCKYSRNDWIENILKKYNS